MEIDIDTYNVMVGGWSMISDLEGELVVMAAKLAVEEHNRRNNLNLSFVSVIRGENSTMSKAWCSTWSSPSRTVAPPPIRETTR
ncbi:hypothetical protein C2S51_019446 [Perilla frutescens var. frutescens]|nr:hypothetical protein C2S51_019446 [Perilla frutescens var. frutescens]